MALIATTYLELRSPPTGDPLAALCPDADVAAERLTPTDYLALWTAVGSPLDWDGRLYLASDTLRDLLADPRTDIYVLRIRGIAAGFCEFNQPDAPDSEIKYFGLLPVFLGQRLGPYLLDAALRAHWTKVTPRRIWLHTDTWDDQRALPLYLRAGFHVFAGHDLPDNAIEADYRAAIGLPPHHRHSQT